MTERPAGRAPDGGLTPAARASIDRTAFDMHRMIIDRLQGHTTPDGVRSALALSAVQGSEFLCALTETAAVALGLGPVRSSLELAEHPHRYIAGTASGVAAFAQRAYRDAALAILEQQIGDPASVEAAVLDAAIALHDNPARWHAQRPDERLAALGACASLGETAPGPAQRLRAAQAMAALIEDALSHRNAQDYARAAQLAARIGRGLREGRWQARDFELTQLDQAFRAISVWYGAPAAADIAAALFEHASALAAQTDSPAARRDLSVSYTRRGEVAQARGDLDAAAEHFEQALALCTALEQDSSGPETWRDLSLSHERLGALAQARGQIEQAEASYAQAVTLHEALVAVAATRTARRGLAQGYERLGDIARAAGRRDAAQAWLAKALAVAENLAREELAHTALPETHSAGAGAA